MQPSIRSLQWRRWVILAALAMAFVLIAAPAALAQDATPEAASPGLQAGKQVTYKQQVPINLVFVGYERGDFKMKDLTGALPNGYSPIVRQPTFYGLSGRDLGLQFNFKYNTTYANADFEDDFFSYLASIGTDGPMTDFQAAYNDMQSNVLDVTDPVLYIDAPSTENWLMSNAWSQGVDTSKGYTIFFVNWYSRPDFRFHVYTKTDEPDPDTGYNFGEIRPSRKIIAWGGSHGRTWFYDLSAGPEAWTDNWAVDFPDLDGDGVEDYRMPAIWEYANDGYRDPDALGGDLGLAARYVAINLLFTSSPLYDPLVTAPGPNGAKGIFTHVFEVDGGRPADGTDYLNVALVGDQVSDLQPYYAWYASKDDTRRPDNGVRNSLIIFSGRNLLPGCWEEFGTAFAQLFCYFDAHYDDYIPAPAFGPEDYQAAVFAYHATQRRMGTEFGLLGFADDNWVDGTQSYVFVFGGEEYRELGYGFTTTVIHEGGHHFGMSHPHDGYDSETGVDYGPGNAFYFAWSGDESHTVMAYLDLTMTFGQFDHDNMNRYEFAGYLNWANQVLAAIQADPDADSVESYVDVADAAAVTAQDAFKAWDYPTAAESAREAYVQVALAAQQLGVSTDAGAFAQMMSPTSAPPREGDPIRFPNN